MMPSKASEVLQYAKLLITRLRASVREKLPEKIIILAGYVSNIIVIITQLLFHENLCESTPIILGAELIVIMQLFIPVFILDVVPLFHYFVLLVFLIIGSVFNLVVYFPIYYYAITVITIISLLKVEPIFMTTPSIIKLTTRMRRAMKKARIPRTIEEAKFSVKLGSIHLVSLIISIFVYAWKMYPPAIVVATYSAVAFLFFFLNIGSNPAMKAPKAKYSLSLLFVLRYPFLFKLANKMKMKIHPLTERAGVLIYELEYVAKYIAMSIWSLMLLPSICLMLITLLPFGLFLLTLPMVMIIPAVIYYMPFMLLSSKARARKSNVEKEYPIFLAYASALISAGYSLYAVFKDLAVGRGAGLLKAFTNEAKYFISLVDKQGLPEIRALEKYAASHPSSEYRNFILGYMHQVQLGGNLATYMEQKLVEALDALKRRMENYVNQIVTLTEIALTVLVLPSLPMIVGFIIAPDIVYNMLFMQMFVFVPAIGMMFYTVANAIQLEFRDEYKFTYIPSVIGAVLSLVIASFLIQQNIVAGISCIAGAAALGFYIEYMRQRKVFTEIEKTLPQMFRDLSELRQMMPIAEALNRLTKMGYPKNVSKILRRVATLRNQGIKLTEQPWHSRSWFWKFTQFLLGKIEETGGGTAELFRQLMMFFTEFNNIMSSIRSSLRIYEFVIYAIPAIFALVSYSTLGIFVAMTEVSRTIGISELSSSGVAELGAEFPQLMKVFQGIDPSILMINDVIIAEMSFILGLLAGKVISGTLRDTRALAIAMIITAVIVIVAPQFVQSMIMENIPISNSSP